MDQNNAPNDTLTPTLVPIEPSPTPCSDPTQIGRYRVIRLLGRGAFGRVYLAQDHELDRPVAIKIPHRQPAPHEDAGSFPSDARIVAGLSHPNIVPVYDVGHAEDGRCFIVAKYIEGGDLAAELKKK